jgi:hypothetical protein
MHAPPRSWLRAYVVPVLAVAMLLITGVSALPGQFPPGDPTAGPPSASLLRRLAASADAYRTGDTVYVVASDSFPHPVLGVYPTLEEARRIAGSAGLPYHYYATLTSRDIETHGLAILPGCLKDPRTTQWICPTDTTLTAIPLESVEAIELVIHKVVGAPIRVRVRPDGVSAFILSLDGFDRHMVPYYTQLFGPAYAAAMRDRLLAYIRRSGSR